MDRVSPLILALFLFLAPASAFADEVMSPDEVKQLARHYADLYGVPPGIVLRTVKRESTFKPSARNGPYWGLMQIRYDTAKGVGYKGTPQGLLDPETNLIYGVAYLANAYMIAGGNESMTHRLYRSGYYYEAKRKQMLAKLIVGPPRASTAILVAAAAPDEPAPAVSEPVPAAVPLPLAKPHIDAETIVAEAPIPPLPPKPPIIAQPKVVLASVLPEPRLSLGYGRETSGASAAALAIAAEVDPANAGDASPPLSKSGATDGAQGQLVPATVRDFSAAYFDIPVKVLPPVPLPRPRPTGVAAAEPTASTLFAAMVVPLPKHRPVAQ